MGQGATFTVDLPLAEDRRDPARAGERRIEIERRRGAGRAGETDASDIQGVKVLLVEDDDDTRQLLAQMLKRQGAEVTSVSSSSEALQALVGTGSEAEAQLRDPKPDSPAEVGRSQTAPGDLVRNHSDTRHPTPDTRHPTPDTRHPTPGTRPIDVIVSDIGMPEEDGYEFMRKVRALPPEQGGLVPAIALTGYAARKDRELALAAGYQLHLAKPVEPEDLVSAIASLVVRRQ
jgi:CheY-like chemotaxis protein